MATSPIRNDDGFYTVEGRALISVTTALNIIDTGIGDWKARVGSVESSKVSREATNLGKQVHRMAEGDVKGEPWQPTKKTEAFKNCAKAYQEWKETYKEKILKAEVFCYSLSQGYAGTADGIGADAVYDFKTSKRISPLYWLQLAAYAWALMEMAHKEGRTLKITRLVVVRLDKEFGTCYQKERPMTYRLINTFLGALWNWEHYNKTEKEDNDDEDARAIASREIEPNRTWNSAKGADETVGGSENSDDRSGEMWQV